MESNDNLKYIIESLLFVSDTPIMLKQIHYIMPDVKMSHIRKAVETLSNEYNERGGSFYLSNVAGGIQLRTRPIYRDWIKRFIKSRPMRLSRAALEALAIVAYKQPVTRSEVDKIRGVDSGAIMRTLVENKLIRIIGRKEVPGRPMLYTTSRRFLEVFDLNDLKDLPAPDDIEIDETEAMEQMDSNADNTEPENEKELPVPDNTITDNTITDDTEAIKQMDNNAENTESDNKKALPAPDNTITDDTEDMKQMDNNVENTEPENEKALPAPDNTITDDTEDMRQMDNNAENTEPDNEKALPAPDNTITDDTEAMKQMDNNSENTEPDNEKEDDIHY